MATSIAGKVCLVTGGSRGIGKGIALQLGESGALVYVTGRNSTDLKKCAEEIKGRGAMDAIPLQVDHSNDEEVKKLFETIKLQTNGRLDLLVNNAYSAVSYLFKNVTLKFWELEPVEHWDAINNVGLRNHFICTNLAARMMVEQGSGLIVNVSSLGGLTYLFDVSYGVGKAAMDRMAADCAHELRSENVAMLSLWPGAVQTEMVESGLADGTLNKSDWQTETTEFVGKAVVHLTGDPNIMNKSGKILSTSDLCREYKFNEADGTFPPDIFGLKNALVRKKHTWLGAFVPSFVRIPKILCHFASYKF